MLIGFSTPVYALDFDAEFVNYQNKIASFHLPSSRNSILLIVEVKLGFGFCSETKQTVETFYELILYEEHDKFSENVLHVESRTQADEKCPLAQYSFKVLFLMDLTHLLPLLSFVHLPNNMCGCWNLFLMSRHIISIFQNILFIYG